MGISTAVNKLKSYSRVLPGWADEERYKAIKDWAQELKILSGENKGSLSWSLVGRAAMIVNGNEDALDPIIDVIHDLVDDLDDVGSGKMRGVTHTLVLMALGDALMGGPLAASLELPRSAARDIAEQMLVEAALKAGLVPGQSG